MCLFLETLVVNTSTPLFQTVLNIDCSRLGMRLDRVHLKNGTVKRTIKSYFRLLEFAKRFILWLVIFCEAVSLPTLMLIRTTWMWWPLGIKMGNLSMLCSLKMLSEICWVCNDGRKLLFCHLLTLCSGMKTCQVGVRQRALWGCARLENQKWQLSFISLWFEKCLRLAPCFDAPDCLKGDRWW